MIRRAARGVLVFAFALVIAPLPSQAADVISNLTTSWNAGFGFSPTTSLGFVFQTGPTSVNLDAISFNLLAGNSATSQTINYTISLYAVDGSNNPTGSALSTDSASATWTNPVGGTFQPQLFSYSNLTNLFALNLSGSTKYALVLSNSDGTPTFEHYWAVLNSSTYTTSNGFSYTGFKRSTNGGTSWATVNSQFLVVSISAVPEPSTYVLAGISALTIGYLGRRRARS